MTDNPNDYYPPEMSAREERLPDDGDDLVFGLRPWVVALIELVLLVGVVTFLVWLVLR